MPRRLLHMFGEQRRQSDALLESAHRLSRILHQCEKTCCRECCKDNSRIAGDVCEKETAQMIHGSFKICTALSYRSTTHPRND